MFVFVFVFVVVAVDGNVGVEACDCFKKLAIGAAAAAAVRH